MWEYVKTYRLNFSYLNTRRKIQTLANQYQKLWLPAFTLIDCILFWHLLLLVLSPQLVGYLLVCPDKTRS